MASQPTWIKKRLENSGVEGLVAPSLRFLQGWGFSDRPNLWFRLSLNLTPHPLKGAKGGAPAKPSRPLISSFRSCSAHP